MGYARYRRGRRRPPVATGADRVFVTSRTAVVAVLVAALIVALLAGGLGCRSGAGGAPPATGGGGQPPAGGAPPGAGGVPGASELPFPASEIERTWPLGPDRTLIAQRWSKRDVTYHVAAGGKCEAIVGAVARAEVRSASPTMVEFVCHGVNDTQFITFPYLLVYDVAAGTTAQREMSWDSSQALEFGGWETTGHVLTGVRLEGGAVVVQFGTAQEALASLGGPIGHIPHTVAQWDSGRGALVLRFAGTVAGPDAAAQAAALASGTFLGVTVAPAADGATELALRLAGPINYNVAHPFGDPCLMTITLGRE